MVPSSLPSGSALPRAPTGPPPPQGNNSSRSSGHSSGHPSMSAAYPPQMQSGVGVNPGHHRSHGQQQQHMNVPRHSQHGGNVNGVGHGSSHSGQPHSGSYPHQPMQSQSNGERSLPSAPPGSLGPGGQMQSQGQHSGGQGQMQGPGPGQSSSSVPVHGHGRGQVQGPNSHGSGVGGPGPSSQSGPGPSSHSHGHSSMPNAPAPSQYHRPLHSPPGSRPGPPGHNPPSHNHPGQGGPGPPGQHPPHHNHHRHTMPPGPGPPHQHHPHHHHPMHPPQHHPGMPPHPPQYHHHYPHHPPQLVPPHHNHGGMPPQSSSNGSGSVGQQGQPGSRYINGSNGSTSGSESRPINGNWQSNKDMEARRDMIQNIVKLLKRSKKKGDITTVLPQMVKQLEVSLYRSAPSYEHYVDQNTLKERLQKLASEISRDPENLDRKANVHGSSNGFDKNKQGNGRPSAGINAGPGIRGPPNTGPGHNQPPYRPGPPPQSTMSQPGVGKDLVNLGNVNSNMIPTPALTSSGSGSNGMPGRPLHGSGSSVASESRPGQSQESKDRLRKQQQRLLLLHHSSKCQAPDGTCKATKYCKEMKRLWSHMAKCEDYNCRTQHCYSSRTILSHYRKCKDQECQICKPVRQSVWSNPKNGKQRRGGREPQPYQPPYIKPVPPGNPQNPTHPTIVCPPISAPVPMPPPSMKVDPGISNNPPVKVNEKNRIVHKQQRLLLLRHASKCNAPKGECTVTPHCHNMKQLWLHISNCSKKDCDTPHCLSSRYVLMHYRKCKDNTCPSCQPVREAIGKSPKRIDMPKEEIKHPNRLKRDRDPTGVPDKKENGVSVEVPPTKKPKIPAEDTTSTLLKSLTVEQIELHIQSLSRVTQLPPKSLKQKCLAVLKVLMDHDDGWVFNSPVDPVALSVPDYFDRIKKPMDLGTINKRLENGHYREIKGFDSDVRLTFDNAMVYNEPNTPVHEMANSLKTLYIDEHKKLIDLLKKEEDERRQNDRACGLCGCEKLQFEPPVFFCSGLNCQSKRIHRNRHFYVGGNSQYNWCTSCYTDLDGAPIHMQDLTLQKDELVKKKNDEINEENWVQCDACDRWIHQICGLFNPRQNKHDDSVKYKCPKCLVKERKECGKPPDKNNPNAEDLPRTKLSEWLENNLMMKINKKYAELARKKAELDNITFEEALHNVSSGGKITIRQVTSSDKKLEVRERMRKRYAHKNYPEEFPYRCKCILVFQELDGVDVVLFALYIYEHDEKNPAPNARTVYISYLDSVYYMRPRHLRTFVYHEILISYLDYARKRGFATAHIWACPPLKGDDYIFFAKPEDQKTPKDNRLRQWYIDMLVECQNRGIVGKLTNMYDLYFGPGKLDATVVPYLEGDYFSGEIENFIKEVEEGKTKGSSKQKNKSKKKGKATDKTKKMRKGTRSGGLDDDFITGDEGKLNDSSNDPVMKQLGDFIKPMKDSFIVAYLNWEGAKAEHLKVPQEIIVEREKRKEYITEVPSMKNCTSSRGKKDRKGNSVRIIDDDTEELECEILETRQAFLNLCRKNHYQFDQPRRAKHTSIMVLWHLHNPDAAKIVQMCFACGKDILNGIRYNCTTCSDYDLCPDCYKNPNANRGQCTHELVPKKVVDGSQNGAGGGITEDQRRERRNHIRLHIQLLEHASLCVDPKCQSSNCVKMKQYLQHSSNCKISHQGGCKICKRILSLLKYHALSCKDKTCKIPQCVKVKERLRQMRRQQQAMDDRRRQVMNRQYRTGYSQN